MWSHLTPTIGKITQDQESTYVYASINHQITPKVAGNTHRELAIFDF